jgi:hypothetical protein
VITGLLQSILHPYHARIIQILLDSRSHGTKNDLVQHSTLHHDKKLPDEWFSELDVICSELLIWCKYGITENETFNCIIYDLNPKIYETIWQLLEEK